MRWHTGSTKHVSWRIRVRCRDGVLKAFELAKAEVRAQVLGRLATKQRATGIGRLHSVSVLRSCLLALSVQLERSLGPSLHDWFREQFLHHWLFEFEFLHQQVSEELDGEIFR